MFDTIKTYIAAATGVLIAALFGYGKYQSSKREQAEAKADKATEQALNAEKRVEVHEKREEIEHDSVYGDVTNVDERLRDPYDRDSRSS